jgi:hypothetical protein
VNNKEFIIGKIKESAFASMYSKVTLPTQSQDMYEHWDLKIEAKIDVKSLKKQSREDILYNENFHWVELMNVRGDKSWLYGDADFFAFETEDYWIIVDKTRLQDFIEAKTKGQEISDSKDPYSLYRRKGRLDIVVKVKTLDLVYIAHQVIKKDEKHNQE